MKKILESISVIIAIFFIFVSAANALPIGISGHFAEPNFGVPNGTLYEEGLPYATDDDLSTGYIAMALPGVINQSQGLRIRWDFDISEYSSIEAFTFRSDGIISQPFIYDHLRAGASPFSNFMNVYSPNGEL